MRTKNSFLNMISSLIPYAIIGVLGFLKIRYCLAGLGSEANGLIQMVYRVLSYLSLAEMGFGSALVYKLYKPLNEKDEQKVNILLSTAHKFFFKVAIGISIFVLGFTFVFPYFVHESAFSNTTMGLVFVLAAIPYIIEYLWYKKYYILVCADQKQYIVNIIFNASTIVYDVLIIVALINGIDLIGYVLLCYPFTLLKGFFLWLYCKKKYPYLKRKTKQIDKSASSLSNDVLVHRVGNLINESSDQIVLSIFKGLTFVSVYTSYFYIVKYLKDIVNSILNASIHSFGNLLVDEEASKNKKYTIFKEYLSVAEVISIIVTIVFFASILSFINIWINNPGYILDTKSIVAFALLVFADIIIIPFSVIITAGGLFKETKLYAFIAAVFNLILSMALISKLEIFGIVIATVITKILLLIPLYINVIFKKTFKGESRNYCYMHLLKCICITFLGFLLIKTLNVSSLYTDSLFNWIIVSGFIFVIVSAFIGGLYLITNKYFKNFAVRCLNFIRRKKA